MKFCFVHASSPAVKKRKTLSWELCIICQRRTTEPPSCPANKTWSGEGYKTLSFDSENFQSAGLLPSEITFD